MPLSKKAYAVEKLAVVDMALLPAAKLCLAIAT
jgi:hypothetical protein